MIDWNDIEIIQGQDHCYWLYSNKRDKYLPTGTHWKYVAEDELKEQLNGASISENLWIDPPYDV